MKILKDIPYRQTSDSSGLCDIYIPDDSFSEDAAVLSIHGGGWGAMSKESFEGVALWLCGELGLPVCNINYRLCGDAPWPACGDDCLTAAQFLLATDAISFSVNKGNRRLIVIGGSSGGHLALMTGLRLPPEHVAGVISISGIADMNADRELAPGRYKNLFSHEPDETEIRNASPASYLPPNSPQILCTHEKNDNVVPIQSAQIFLDAVHRNGTVGKSYFYEKSETGFSHRIWIPHSAPHKLYPDIEHAISSFIVECLNRRTN